MISFLKFAFIIFLMFGGGISVCFFVFNLFYTPLEFVFERIPVIKKVANWLAGILAAAITGLVIYLLYLLIRPLF